MPIKLNFDGMEMTLSDDRALEVVAQIGQLLKTKPVTSPKRTVTTYARTYRSRRFKHPEGTLKSLITEFISQNGSNPFTIGIVKTYLQKRGAKNAKSSVSWTLSKLGQQGLIKRLSKGIWISEDK